MHNNVLKNIIDGSSGVNTIDPSSDQINSWAKNVSMGLGPIISYNQAQGKGCMCRLFKAVLGTIVNSLRFIIVSNFEI